MKYLDLGIVLALHERQIEVWGGSEGVRDLGLLESALVRPQASFGGEDLYAGVFAKAAALMCSLIMNHPFVDGNKRTGVIAVGRFLYLNGYELTVKWNKLRDVALAIEKERWSVGKLAEWFEENSEKFR